MRFYTGKHTHVCGVDLHTRSLYLCVVDHQSEQPLLHKNVRAEPAAFLAAIAPFRDDLVVGCEATFPWYWLADLCHDQGVPFVLGHPYYMRAIHGAKVKNDRVDSQKIALLLRSGMFPLAYAYPRAWRATRDLLRRRTFFMRKRAELLAHVVNTRSQYNLPPVSGKLNWAKNRAGVAEAFADPAVQTSVAADLTLIGHYDDVLRDLELTILRSAREHAPQTLHLLRTVPGIGKILALNLLYEVHDIHRFATVGDFVSYCRLIRPDKTSAGKRVGSGPTKVGNAHLRWTFGEAAAGFSKQNPTGQRIVERLRRKHDRNAMNVLAHKLGRAVYFMLRRQRGIRHQATDELTDGGPPASPTPNWLSWAEPRGCGVLCGLDHDGVCSWHLARASRALSGRRRSRLFSIPMFKERKAMGCPSPEPETNWRRRLASARGIDEDGTRARACFWDAARRCLPCVAPGELVRRSPNRCLVQHVVVAPT